VDGPVRNWRTYPLAAKALAAFVVGAAVVPAMAAAVPLRGATVLVVLWCLLWAAGAGVVAWKLGPLLGVPAAIAVAFAVDSFYILPTRTFDSQEWVNYLLTAMYIGIGVFVGAIIEVTQRRAMSSETALGRLDEEQAALRRVATLVARGSPPDAVFTAVAMEMQSLVGADVARIMRFEPDGTGTLLAGSDAGFEPGPFGALEPPLAAAEVVRTGRTARVDDYGDVAEAIRRRLGVAGVRPSVVASPVVVAGGLWGAIVVGTGNGPLPAETERRAGEFTELLAIAIGSASSRAELAASRARVVVAGDEVRRRLERNLHDGVQQRLVSLALRLRRIERRVADDDQEVKIGLSDAVEELNAATEEVREIAQGIHPAILTHGGLGPALRNLARASPIPVEVAVEREERMPEPIEVAAYFVAAEALANVVKHAEAAHAWVTVERQDGVVWMQVRDDGVGGADPSGGSGLIGLRDRVEAIGGSLVVHSPRGRGTALDATLPVAPPGSPEGSG
jgi:signal transduction histidine kinase